MLCTYVVGFISPQTRSKQVATHPSLDFAETNWLPQFHRVGNVTLCNKNYVFSAFKVKLSIKKMSRLARRLAVLAPPSATPGTITTFRASCNTIATPPAVVPLVGARRLLSTSLVMRAPNLQEAATLISAPSSEVANKIV